LRQQQRSQLNAEVVDAFLSVYPPYPVGMDAVITAGPYRGFRGVVAGANRRALDRPTVRLVYDAAGAPLSPPLEVHLADEPAVAITCAPEAIVAAAAE
jgi:hypothetical protein